VSTTKASAACLDVLDELVHIGAQTVERVCSGTLLLALPVGSKDKAA